jgi:hypothetical protein
LLLEDDLPEFARSVPTGHDKQGKEQVEGAPEHLSDIQVEVDDSESEIIDPQEVSYL